MKYRNAKSILPDELLAELQKYAEGELIYIPFRQPRKAGWGTVNGSRDRYALRNTLVMHQYRKGSTVEEISREFFLSKDSIKKIIRAHANSQAQP